MSTLLTILFTIISMAVLVILLACVCYYTLTRRPESTLSHWIRKHIVTDHDLDPPH
jgi:hypothetical protein